MKRVFIFSFVLVLCCFCCFLYAEPAIKRVCSKEACFKVELAATEESRHKGLMYRTHLNDDEGMLFVFDASGEYGFWMKNTLLALDMIWLDEDRQVVHIRSNVPPCASDPCPVYSTPKAARYVLELPAGTALQRGINLGDVLQMNIER